MTRKQGAFVSVGIAEVSPPPLKDSSGCRGLHFAVFGSAFCHLGAFWKGRCLHQQLGACHRGPNFSWAPLVLQTNASHWAMLCFEGRMADPPDAADIVRALTRALSPDAEGNVQGIGSEDWARSVAPAEARKALKALLTTCPVDPPEEVMRMVDALLAHELQSTKVCGVRGPGGEGSGLGREWGAPTGSQATEPLHSGLLRAICRAVGRGGGGSNDPRSKQHNPQHANYWAPLTRKRHTPPHPAQPQHTDYWAPRTWKRHQQEHQPQRPSESSDPTQHAKGRMGDCPGPRKETATPRNVTQGGGGFQSFVNSIIDRQVRGGQRRAAAPPPLHLLVAGPLASSCLTLCDRAKFLLALCADCRLCTPAVVSIPPGGQT